MTAVEFLNTESFTKLTSTGICDDKDKIQQYAELYHAEKIANAELPGDDLLDIDFGSDGWNREQAGKLRDKAAAIISQRDAEIASPKSPSPMPGSVYSSLPSSQEVVRQSSIQTHYNDRHSFEGGATWALREASFVISQKDLEINTLRNDLLRLSDGAWWAKSDVVVTQRPEFFISLKSKTEGDAFNPSFGITMGYIETQKYTHPCNRVPAIELHQALNKIKVYDAMLGAAADHYGFVVEVKDVECSFEERGEG